jgi:RND family efflux transporter MFP subunit
MTRIRSVVQRSVTLLTVAPFLLSACAPAPQPGPPPPTLVKTEVLTPAATGFETGFVGTLRAAKRSELSFESGGRISAINVEVGDRVRAGQILAHLDQAPLRWRLDKAQAEHQAAIATLHERQLQLEQQEVLAREQIISPTALATTRAAEQQANSQFEVAKAALHQAERDMRLARIAAPYDGEIVARLAQPHSEAVPGQSILQLQGGRALELLAMLPDSVAATLSIGATATAIADGTTLALILERLSARSEQGALVQAIFRVEHAPQAVRAGSLVELHLQATTRSTAITLPASALLPGGQPGHATVFVLPPSGKLQQRKVQTAAELLPNGRISVTQGLAAGERVVVAGAPFLREGQLAAVLTPQTLLLPGAPK